MIDYIEASKSKQAGCQRCHEYITDKMRGVEETAGYGHKEYHYFCIKCSGEIIKQVKKDLQTLEATIKFQTRKLKNKV